MIQDRAIDSSEDATAVTFEPTQGIMAVGYTSGTIRLFSDKLPTNIELSTGMHSEIRHLVALPSQPVIAAIDGLGTLWVFDTDLLKLCFSYKVPLAPTCAGLLAGTNWLLIGTEAGRLYFVDVLEGKKSDFSIECQVRMPSPVVSVGTHPVETEKLLIAYSEGTCVVCDLGKASGSGKGMLVSRHRLDRLQMQRQNTAPVDALVDSGSTMLQTGWNQRPHRDSAHGYCGMEPELTSAIWSPDGSLIAAAYDNSTICVFDTNTSSISPIATRTMLSLNSEHASVDTPDHSLQYVGNIRWCTLVNTDQTFILVTSGLSRSSQRYVSILETGVASAPFKGSNDITPRSSLELTGVVESLCLLPQQSPWRNGSDGIYGIAMVTRQRHHTVLALEIGPTNMELREMASLPGEIVWCNYHATTTIQAQAKVDLSICGLLQACLASKITVPAGQPKTHMNDGMSIEHLICTADTTKALRLWCTSSARMELAGCDGLVLNIENTSRMLGIEHQNVSAIDLNANNGLMAVGLNTGEILLCALTDNPQLSVAQRSTPLSQIRELAQEFYAERREVLSQKADRAREAESRPDMPWLEPMPPSKPRSSQDSETSTSGFSRARMRGRAASTHDGHFLRRSSTRLSASIGSLLRRGSVVAGKSGESAKHQSEASTNRKMHSSILSTGSSYSTESHAVLPRPVEINRDVWKASQSSVNYAMSHMVYGLRLATDDIRCISEIKHRGWLESSDAEKTARTQQETGPDHTQSKPLILPFMLARFYSSKVIDIVAGPNGIIAIAFEDGAVVAIDCVKQEVVLSDNINQTPTMETKAKDIFRLPASALAANAQESATSASITALGVCEIKCSSGESEHGPGSNKCIEILVVGTSLGYVLVYSICRMEPPVLMAVRSGVDDSILLVSAENPMPHGQDGLSTKSTGSDLNQAQDSILVISSQTAITTHAGTNSEPVATYTLLDDSRLIAANIITLISGWHGVAGIDSQWNLILLTLPDLKEEAVISFAKANGVTPSTMTKLASTKPIIQISSTGRILLTGNEGLLMQASVIDTRYHVATDTYPEGKRTYFDIALQPPPLPSRKGISSWLFGKSANASSDTTAFLSSHTRNLIVNGAVKPGVRFIKEKEPLEEEATEAASPSNMSKRTDSKIEDIAKDTELGPFSGMKMMAERRGQQLEDLGDRTQRMAAESQKFLENIRAYNAKQEKSSKKRFGLF
ncbi:Lethal(2) giant larvae sro7 [Coemansia sp. RSA 487]|nr:Lethal(2) giant larvae sro7 [Coemansia sp. RSA 487]